MTKKKTLAAELKAGYLLDFISGEPVKATPGGGRGCSGVFTTPG